MKNIFKAIIFHLLIFNNYYLHSQSTKELEFLTSDKLKHYDLCVNDQSGQCITGLNFSKDRDTGKYKTDFQLYGNKISIDRFNYAIANKEANRLYAFGPKIFFGDHTNINYLHIYDLKGKSIFSDYENVIIGDYVGFEVSDDGDVVIAGSTLDKNNVILKFDKNGIFLWKGSLPNSLPVLDIKLAKNGHIAVLQNPLFGPQKNGVLSFYDGLSGTLINEILTPRSRKIASFNGKEVIFGFRGRIRYYPNINKNLNFDSIDLLGETDSFLINSKLSSSPSSGYIAGLVQKLHSKDTYLLLFKIKDEKLILEKELNIETFKNQNDKAFLVNYIRVSDKGEVTLFGFESSYTFQ